MFSCIETLFFFRFSRFGPEKKKDMTCQVVLAFLPTALYLIIRNLMSVKSSSEAQPGRAFRKVGIYED